MFIKAEIHIINCEIGAQSVFMYKYDINMNEADNSLCFRQSYDQT